MPKKKVVKAKGAPAKVARKKAAGKTALKKAAKAPVKRVAKAAAPTRVSLGRPKVTGDEELYMLFREDYHARQIFEFLRVETVRELERFSPQQIVDRLSAPIVETVLRIRRTLAGLNRSLAGDEAYALERKQAARAK